uniref:Uncharacterized protein HLSG-g27 n=1 Tax=Haemaphysalis longicornis TaxID=44386 RepID=Q4R1A1_HAELO|nr:hypothetical protein [Haemaphysalis longicornis]
MNSITLVLAASLMISVNGDEMYNDLAAGFQALQERAANEKSLALPDRFVLNCTGKHKNKPSKRLNVKKSDLLIIMNVKKPSADPFTMNAHLPLIAFPKKVTTTVRFQGTQAVTKTLAYRWEKPRTLFYESWECKFVVARLDAYGKVIDPKYVEGDYKQAWKNINK